MTPKTRGSQYDLFILVDETTWVRAARIAAVGDFDGDGAFVRDDTGVVRTVINSSVAEILDLLTTAK